MSGAHVLKLQPFKGRELTENEIILQQFFDNRDEEHRRQMEKKQRKSSLLVDDFFQDSGRNDPLKAKAKPPSPEARLSQREREVQEELLRHKQKGIMANAAAPATIAPPMLEPSHTVSQEREETDGSATMTSGSVRDQVTERTQRQPARSSRYHISAEYAQQVKLQQQQSDSSETVDAPSSLIKKRARDPEASDFSDKKLSLPVDLPTDQLDPSKFPAHQLLLEHDWSPLLACEEEQSEEGRLQEEQAGCEGAREFILRDFSMLKNQTLAFKITVPANSSRWAINIGPADPSGTAEEGEDGLASHSMEPCEDWQDILFHFNPRYARRKEVVQATLQGGLWTFSSRQNDMQKMKDAFPAKTFTLIIQVRPDGFYTSVNGIFLSIFPHRSDITCYKHLRLQLPITDDNGNPENAIFHKVWWGRRDPSHNLDFIGCSQETISDRLKKTEEMAKHIYVGGLPYTDNLDKLDDLRAFLLEIFDEFGPEPESLELPPGKGFARMKLESVEQAEAAIATYNRYLVQSEDDPNDEFNLIVAHAR